jgi:hypothetical protein
MIHLTGPLTSQARIGKKPSYNFLSFSHHNSNITSGNIEESPVFQIDSNGKLFSSSGSALFGSATSSSSSVAAISKEDGVIIDTSLSLKGNLFFSPRLLHARWSEKEEQWQVSLSLSSVANYLILQKDPSSSSSSSSSKKSAKDERIKVILDFASPAGISREELLSSFLGKTMILTNNDGFPVIFDSSLDKKDSTMTGATNEQLIIPSKATVFLLFNGVSFINIESLKAPMSHLSNIESFTAKNDLTFGNITLTVGKVVSTALSPSSLLFVDKYGSLSEHKGKLSYTKGILSSPSLKFDRLASSFDGQGNEINNVQLKNPKILNGMIQANEITLLGSGLTPGQPHTSLAGVAYFNEKGQLMSSKTMSLEPMTHHLIIKELHSSIDGNSHFLKNINIVGTKEEGGVGEGSHLMNINSGDFQHLYLSYAKTPTSPSTIVDGGEGDADLSSSFSSNSSHRNPYHGSLLFIDGNRGGEVLPLSSSILSVDTTSSTLSIQRLSLDARGGMISSLNMNGHSIVNAHIESSSFSNIHSLSVSDLIIESFKEAAGAGRSNDEEGISGRKGHRLVYTNSAGHLSTFTSFESEIEIPNLRVNNLQFSSGKVDFHHNLLSNVRFDSSTIDYGKPSLLTVKSLVIESNEVKNQRLADDEVEEGGEREKEREKRGKYEKHFLFSSSSGEVMIIPGFLVNNHANYIDFSSATASTASSTSSGYTVKMKELEISSGGNVKFLNADLLPTIDNTLSDRDRDFSLSSSSSSSKVLLPLGIDNGNHGKLSYLSSLSLKSLEISSKLILKEGSEVILSPSFSSSSTTTATAALSSSGLLGVDSNGKIVKITTSSSTTAGEEEETAHKINARFFNLSSSSLHNDHLLKTSSLVVRKELSFGSSFLSSHSLLSLSPSADHLLTVDASSGKVHSYPFILIHPGKMTGSVGNKVKEGGSSLTPSSSSVGGGLRLNYLSSLSPASGDRLVIEYASIEKSDLISSTITDATAISTSTLVVSDFTELRSDVTIGRSLAVFGSVSGSGAYVDTSDLRLKSNIRKAFLSQKEDNLEVRAKEEKESEGMSHRQGKIRRESALDIIDQLEVVSSLFLSYLVSCHVLSSPSSFSLFCI